MVTAVKISKKQPRKKKTTEQNVATIALPALAEEHMDVSTLETWLWDAACAVRGAADAPKFKDFILPLVFFKRLSDVFDDEFVGQVKEFGDEGIAREVIQADHEDALRNNRKPIVRFFIPHDYRWDAIRNDKAKERAIGHFDDKERRGAFFKFFRQLQNVYEVISPDAFLRPFIEDYLSLAELYALIRTAYGDRIYVDREVSNKTRELLQQHTITGQLEIPGAVHSLGPEELAKLKDSDTTDTTKILNLRKILVTTVQQDGLSKPFLLSIGERAEKLAEAYEDRQVTTQQALLDFEKLAREVTEADVERQKLGLDANTFAIHKTVSVALPGSDGTNAKVLNALFEAQPDYRWNKQQESKLRTALYKTLRPLVGTEKMIGVANQLLRLQRV